MVEIRTNGSIESVEDKVGTTTMNKLCASLHVGPPTVIREFNQRGFNLSDNFSNVDGDEAQGVRGRVEFLRNQGVIRKAKKSK